MLLTGKVLLFNAPTGGISQFKGLTSTGTAEAKYVQMICSGVQPFFGTAGKWNSFTADATTNGFMFTCHTGISQCALDISAATGNGVLALSTTEMASCLADPRYMTWRMVTTHTLYSGAKVWWRTDSYWNPADDMPRSTWGPSLKLSAN